MMLAHTPRSPSSGTSIDVLRTALARIRTGARRWVWIETLGLLCLWGAALFWLSLLCDWIFEPPWQVRGMVVLAGGIGLGWLLVTKLLGRLAAPLDDRQLALLVERAHPQFRDSLSTAIELAGTTAADVDPRLLDSTTAMAVARLDDVQPATIFRRRSLGALTAVGLLAAASITGLVVGQPAAAGLWAERMLLLHDTPWPRSVRLEAEGFIDGVRVVARGADVDLLVRAVADRQIPEIVDLRSRGSGPHGRGWRTERMGTRGGRTTAGQLFGHVLKGVSESLELEVRGGDARLRPLRLEVVDPPMLDALNIAATLPEYLGGGTRRAATSRVVAVPRGSAVEISCTATKPLSAATLSVVVDGTETTVAELAHGGVATPERTISARLDDVMSDRTVIVRFTDTDGLVNRDPITFVISAVPDEPPQAALRLLGISTAVTPGARVPIAGTISDDHGLAAATVTTSVVESAQAAAPSGVEAVQPIARVQPGMAVVEFTAEAPETVTLRPVAPPVGSRLAVVVTAVDGCALADGPNRVSAGSWTLDVVTPEALQAMLEAREVILRRRFESVIADCEQARDRLASAAADGDERAVAQTRMGESAGRAAGEIAEIAAAFRDIRLELDNNALLTPEIDIRLIRQIADPLSTIAEDGLPSLATACRPGVGPGAGPADLVRQADRLLTQMRAVLAMMMELESFNEVIERLRGVIRAQEDIRSDTLEQQKKRARAALEGL